MIKAIEFVPYYGAGLTLRADKNVRERNAWHLKRISGNGLPPVSLVGEASHKLAGRSYGGISIDEREIELELYADGYSAAGLQAMMRDVSRVMSVQHDTLGYLRLVNASGEEFRIQCRPTEFEVDETRHRTMSFTGVFECPYVFFEDDAPTIVPLFAVQGGKEHPQGSGLERPYTFGNIVAGSGQQTIVAVNNGDVEAPCTFRMFGAGLSSVEIVNNTTGASIEVGGRVVSGIEICTDPNNLYARFSDGTDASRYVSLFSDISAFQLAAGANEIVVTMTATSVTPAGTEIEHRGRYTTCL